DPEGAEVASGGKGGVDRIERAGWDGSADGGRAVVGREGGWFELEETLGSRRRNGSRIEVRLGVGDGGKQRPWHTTGAGCRRSLEQGEEVTRDGRAGDSGRVIA